MFGVHILSYSKAASRESHREKKMFGVKGRKNLVVVTQQTKGLVVVDVEEVLEDPIER